MTMDELLRSAVEKGASDIFIGAGRRIIFKIDGVIIPQDDDILNLEKSTEIVTQLFETGKRGMERFLETGDDDFTVSIKGLSRFRVNAYRQRSSMAAVIRLIHFDIPHFEELSIPKEVMRIAEESHGIVLVTGPAGSGKTTTLACIIDQINKARNCHIITLEDPIEFLHRDNKSIVSQREIEVDSNSYMTALRACLRQAPDIILLGEMRDHETIRTAMTAAETGHLVISTLHTVGAVNTIDRIIDVFPADQQQQIRIELAMLLKSVVSQKLIPSIAGGLTPVFEIMNTNSAIRTLIREAKAHQIDGVIQTSSQEGMISMDQYLMKLYNNRAITTYAAIEHAINPEQFTRRVMAT
ncbi:MAG: PilT/PilU family type 4a pilus ATPase [Lachnospiraceae bacterium]|nr:PilT/PilU family type 4a pilus ATPase [Lachnospiraceae bacterium]